eukprot:515483_1
MSEMWSCFLFFTFSITRAAMLQTSWQYTPLGEKGQMFDLKNIRSFPLRIERFDIQTEDHGKYNITIYTKCGSYKGYEYNATSWTLIHQEIIYGAGQGHATQLTTLQKTVNIPAEATQSFFFHVKYGYLMEVKGTKEGSLYVADENLAFYEGADIKGAFSGKTAAPYIWTGNIYYTPISPQPTYDPTVSPTETTLSQPSSSWTKYSIIIISVAVALIVLFFIYWYIARKGTRSKQIAAADDIINPLIIEGSSGPIHISVESYKNVEWCSKEGH